MNREESTNRVPPSGTPGTDQPCRQIHLELPCYEGPEGRGPGTWEITEDALCRHIFACGSTGSGKTTLLRSLTRQLIAANADSAKEKSGLVILDFKGDSTVKHVKAAAAAVGRAGDVSVLSLDGNVAYDFFGEFTSLNQANEFAERLLFGCRDMGGQNDVFWQELRINLFSAALTWLITIRAEDRSFANWISHAASWLLTDGMPRELSEDRAQLKEKAESVPPGTVDRIALDQAIRLIEDWDGNLDPRTRGNARATLHNALRPLLEEPVLRLFRQAPVTRRLRVAQVVERGKILVVSINAFLHPHLAALVGKCIKSDFYRSVFARKPGGRFTALIADEFQLVATSGSSRYDDATALPLLREYRAAMVCATQTLVGLDKVVGQMNRRLLMANFNTIAFLRSTEPELEAFAEQVCGTTETEIVISEQAGENLAEVFVPTQERRYRRRVRKAICPRGSLARLEPGQAYLLRQNGEVCMHPVWLAEER